MFGKRSVLELWSKSLKIACKYVNFFNQVTYCRFFNFAQKNKLLHRYFSTILTKGIEKLQQLYVEHLLTAASELQ